MIDVQWANFWINVALALFTLLAVIVALFQQKFWNWKNKPKIEFILSNEEPYVVQVIGEQSEIIRYFRLKIKNNGQIMARNCHIKLISVIQENNNSNRSLVEPDKLDWSNSPLDMSYRIKNWRIFNTTELRPISREKLDISPHGGWEFCDLFKMGSFNTTILTFLSQGERKIPILYQDGNYIVTIEIFGDNIERKEAKFRIKNSNSFYNMCIEWIR